MRVISGNQKSKALKAVPGTSTRPTTDKVKEAIFNMVGPYFQGGLGLDLYGGSGGLGIEGLSRGLEKVIFVDVDRKAIETIKSNLNECGYTQRGEVYRNEAKKALKALFKRDIAFSYIFLDPPYAKQNLKAEIESISDYNLLDRNGTIVVEHHISVKLPALIKNIICIKQEQYGDTVISIYQFDSADNHF